MQYVAMLWTEKKGKLLQVFGPYYSADEARRATEKMDEWPAFRSGTWEITPMYPDPKENHPAPVIPYQPVYPTTIVYPTHWSSAYPTYTYSGVTTTLSITP